MNDRQLRYAVKVRDELSFSRAAERLLLSQSSISEQVRTLEDELGFALFRRAGRGVEVTQAGRIFLRQAEETLASFTGLNDLGRHLRQGPTSRFSLGMSPGIVQVLTPIVVEALGPMISNIRLSIGTSMAPQLQRLVLQQVLDLGISIQISPKSAQTALVWEPITDVEIALFVPPGHRLVGSERAIDIADITNEPLIMSEPTLGYGALVQSMFTDLGVQPRVVSVADQTTTVKTMIQSGLGIGILPAITARAEVEAGQLIQLPLRPARTVSIYIVRAAKTLDPHVEISIGRIRTALAKQNWRTFSNARKRH
jgi:DNA-binding transcriptional LysR family regulator